MKAGAWAQSAIAAAGGIAGLITIIFGRSSTTAANNSNKSEAEPSPVKSLALALAAPVFVLIVLVGLSLGTTALINSLKAFLANSPLGIDWHVEGLEGSLASWDFHRWDFHMIVVHNTSLRVLVLIAAILLAIGLVMSVCININKFSLHAMYRNRLIRAYLGASHEEREPNPFTGFDPDDNISIHELRPERFHAGSLTQATSLLTMLADDSNPVSKYLTQRIDEIRSNSKEFEKDEPRDQLTPDGLIRALNEVLDGPSIYNEQRFANVSLDPETRTLLGQKPTGNPLAIERIDIYSRKNAKVGKYCAVGKIHYSAVDGGDPEKTDGTLIYIKPAMCGGEPADVFNYAQQSKVFPHESTADQFFSESQFESYRMLGLHTVQQISEGGTPGTLDEWAHHLSTVYLA